MHKSTVCISKLSISSNNLKTEFSTAEFCLNSEVLQILAVRHFISLSVPQGIKILYSPVCFYLN